MNFRLLLIGLALCGLPVMAQQPAMDSNLKALVDIVVSLRASDQGAYNRAQSKLSTYTFWTPMNETGRVQATECLPSDKVPGFKLNRMLARIETDRVLVTSHGDMLNGGALRIANYLFERSITAGRSVTYTLKGREGKQAFVIVAYNPKAAISVTVDGKSYKPENGVITFPAGSKDLRRDQSISFTVTSQSPDNQSFVILNHNTRNK